MLEILGEIDRGHPTLTDLTLDAVAPLEGCVQAGDGIRAVHAPMMRLRTENRERILLGMDSEDGHRTGDDEDG